MRLIGLGRAASLTIMLLVTLSSGSRASGREPVGALWEKYMLEGNAVVAEIKDTEIDAGERSSTEPFTYARGSPESAVYTRRGISVMRLGDGIFRNVAEKRPHPTEGVRATLRYDPATRMATVTIVGLRRPVEDQVNLTTVLQTGSQ